MAVAVLLLAPDTLVAQKTSAQAHADRGLQFAQQGDLAGAEIELRQAAKLAPDDPDILGELGTVLAMEKKLEESSSVLERALKIKPADIQMRRYLAANSWQLHRYADARRNLEIILKQKPGDAPTLLLMGMVAENSGDYATAARSLSAVPSLVQQQPEAVAALARSYYRLQQIDKARATLDGLSNHPAGPQAGLLGAEIADEARDYEKAEQLLRSIKPDDSHLSAVGYRLAVVQYHDQRSAEARQTLLALIASGHRGANVYNLLGWCYQDSHQLADATQAFEEAIRLEPQKAEHYLDLGNILVANRKYPAALAVAKRAANALPSAPSVFLFKGSVELKVGQFTDALASYSQAQQLEPSSPDAALGVARAKATAGLTKNAIADFESGIKQFPKDARFWLYYGVLMVQQSETGDAPAEAHAAELLKSAVEIDPDLAEAHYQLGNLALKNGNNSEAVTHLERAEKLDGDSQETHFALSRAYRRLGREDDAAREMDLYNKLKDTSAPTS
ncbi:MAG TPA: tetratricopeptide repeat protein [Terriglobales bacterium]